MPLLHATCSVMCACGSKARAHFSFCLHHCRDTCRVWSGAGKSCCADQACILVGGMISHPLGCFWHTSLQLPFPPVELQSSTAFCTPSGQAKPTLSERGLCTTIICKSAECSILGGYQYHWWLFAYLLILWSAFFFFFFLSVLAHGLCCRAVGTAQIAAAELCLLSLPHLLGRT